MNRKLLAQCTASFACFSSNAMPVCAATTQDACRDLQWSEESLSIDRIKAEGLYGLYWNIVAASSNQDCGMELSIEWCVLCCHRTHHAAESVEPLFELTLLLPLRALMRMSRWVLFFELFCVLCVLLISLGTEVGFRFDATFTTFMAICTGLMVVMAPRSTTEAWRFADLSGK